MNYVSTRGTAPILGFEDAMLAGLARDGGLYVPENWPVLDRAGISCFSAMSYEEVAFAVMRPFVGDAFPDEDFLGIIERAYGCFAHQARCPLVQTDANEFLLELFHGPTLAFKDVALQLIGQLFESTLKRRGTRVTIAGATSGDTGSAAIEAFRGLESVDVFIMYPHGRVSEVQRRQMTTPDDANVHALAVDGTFDDCQSLLKGLFNDLEFRDRASLAAVNSINWARVLAQTVYYFTAATALGVPHREVSFTVPTGNFGDVYAGYVARRMGLPIDRLVVATNQNDILDRALNSGIYRTSAVRPSISPSMDIQVSSNFERVLFDACGRDGASVAALMKALATDGAFELPRAALEALRREFVSGRASERETRETMRRVHAATGRVICPHTAVGMKVAQEQSGSSPMVVLATAHAAKFPDAASEACGVSPPLPEAVGNLVERPERIIRVGNDLDAVKSVIESESA